MNGNQNIDYINYQKLLNKSKKRVTAGTVGKVVIKIFATILKFIEELNKRANIHGLQHAVNTKLHPLERIVWLLFVVGACYGVYSIGNLRIFIKSLIRILYIIFRPKTIGSLRC